MDIAANVFKVVKLYWHRLHIDGAASRLAFEKIVKPCKLQVISPWSR